MDAEYVTTIKQRRRRWAEALTSGQFIQGTGSLKGIDGRYCCLGVACEVFSKDLRITSHRPKRLPRAMDRNRWGFSVKGEVEAYVLLPEPLRIYLGLTQNAQSILMHLNDSGVDFGVIALILDALEIEPQE